MRMEITLEKIELVKDRTGVSYKEAKEALEAVDGSVVDAIIAIEETVNLNSGSKVSEFADETIEKVKELVKKGNITKIAVKKDNETLVNIPLNVGLVGALVAPWGIIAATVAAFGFKCQIELTKDDGTVIDISEKAEVIANDVKEKGSVVVDEVVAKGTDLYEDIKANAPDMMVEIKEKGVEAYNTIVDMATDTWNEIKEKKNEEPEVEVEFIYDEGEDSFDEAEEKLDDLLEKEEQEEQEEVEL